MLKTETGTRFNNKRLGILLLLSISVHCLFFISLNYNITKLPDLISNQAGTQFSITLHENQVSVSSDTFDEKEKSVVKHKSIIKKSQKETEKTVKNANATNKKNSKKRYLQARNIPSTAHVIASINQQLHEHFYYPIIARKQNWQGRVLLTFKINDNGEVKNINVIESSGYNILDSAAVKALKKLNKIASNFHWPQNGIKINLPVIYQLTKG